MAENARLFFAVNIPEETKNRIFAELVETIPQKSFGKTRRENLHITIAFLGYFPKEKIVELEKKAQTLKNFKKFEAELNEIGHFRGRVLWLGTGKGTEEFNLLAKKLCEAIEMPNEEFHAHVTLARNKSAEKKEFDAVVEKLHAKKFFEKICANSFDLMQSIPASKGQVYKKVFSIKFSG
jgi:2'-5' RNA ligase